jgi:protein-tyrosine phosphatase
MVFQISELPLGAGRVGICPLPGRSGDYRGDLDRILTWGPSLVVSLVCDIELEAGDAENIGHDLAQAGVAWRHLPVTDFRAPCAETAAEWPAVSEEARAVLARGGSVLMHCYGGRGRSGMALTRLMVESGETPAAALARLRQVLPEAVETAAQAAWAALPSGTTPAPLNLAAR